ncbi:hypothetical protein F5I97DRAFT_1065411 [Phlebopus sp. FC_14]|nr:hypothetical protein F5I97DRAFT_1065411 [Phlebopus sp. FC_14]
MLPSWVSTTYTCLYRIVFLVIHLVVGRITSSHFHFRLPYFLSFLFFRLPVFASKPVASVFLFHPWCINNGSVQSSSDYRVASYPIIYNTFFYRFPLPSSLFHLDIFLFPLPYMIFLWCDTVSDAYIGPSLKNAHIPSQPPRPPYTLVPASSPVLVEQVQLLLVSLHRHPRSTCPCSRTTSSSLFKYLNPTLVIHPP